MSKSKNVGRGAMSVAQIWDRLEEGNFGVLEKRVLSENEAKELAANIKKTSSFGDVFHLIEAIPDMGRTYDWNVGGILQHLDIGLVVSSMQHTLKITHLYESVGLAWAFGQFRNRNQFIVDFLYSTVQHAQNSDAWWQAAFSLENLNVDNAVNLLKRSIKSDTLQSAGHYMGHLDDKRSLIALLLMSDASVQTKLYPKIREALLGSDETLIANCCWLAGRLRIFDDEIIASAARLLASPSYDVRHYAFFALQNHPTEKVRAIFERELSHSDGTSRKFAARGLRVIGSQRSLEALEQSLAQEADPAVIFELSKSIYRMKNPLNAERLRIRQSAYGHENGAITGNPDAAMYDAYAESQDPEGLCISLVLSHAAKKKIINPIDARMRSGRVLRQMFAGLEYEGTLYGVDRSKDMCTFADRSVRRERNFRKDVQMFAGTLGELGRRKNVKSNFIVSAYGYEGLDQQSYLADLKQAYHMLTDDGLFYSIGWDEMYNDALSSMWFKYVPDGIVARDFEEWRERRMGADASRTAGGLTWISRGIHAPLQFHSMEESARVMGYLFGRDAAQYAIRNRRTEWSMSLGITCDTKKSLGKAIAAMEASM